MRPNKAALPAIVLLGIGLLSACSGGDTVNSTALQHAAAGHLTIGVASDQPGLGYKDLNGVYRGFDIDVAVYVAGELGVQPSGITWLPVTQEGRPALLQNGTADFVVDDYSITDDRKKTITFAGPYFIAGQDLLVRMNETDITGPESLNNGKKLCSVTGTTGAQDIKDKFASQTKLVEYPRHSDCIPALLAGIVDAVATDDAILAGYAAQDPELMRLVGKPFTQERYGVGMKHGDTEAQAKVDAAIEKMISSGRWKESLQQNFGASGYKIPPPPTITEK